MSGIYGTVKPANINITEDVTIYYSYKPNRGYDGLGKFQELSASNLLATTINGNINIDGLYNLKLPLQTFGKKGIYTIYITPKEHIISLYAVGTLAEYSEVRGILLNIEDLPYPSMMGEGSLVGYRLEYGDFTRIITSSNRCEVIPITGQNKYRLSKASSNSNLLFCTLTPSAANGFNPSDIPDIGTQGTPVKLVNTKFNPIMFEIEMVEHDAETLSYMIGGTQVRNLDNGIFTTYNDNNEIFKQYDTYTIKTQLGKPLYDVKESRQTIDVSQNYNSIISEE